MTRVLEATCQAGVVKVGDLPVPGTTILSEGVASSSGVLVLEGDQAPTYIGKTTPDLKTTLEKIASALTEIAAALTVIDAKPVGGTGSAPAPAAAASILQIQAVQTELSALKESLK